MIYIKLKSVKKHCICLQTNLWSRFLQPYYLFWLQSNFCSRFLFILSIFYHQ